jgi:hypothetical protein
VNEKLIDGVTLVSDDVVGWRCGVARGQCAHDTAAVAAAFLISDYELAPQNGVGRKP